MIRKHRNLLFYILTIGVFGLLMYSFVKMGGTLELKKVSENVILQNNSARHQFSTTYHQNLAEPLAILLLQIITILITARLFGYLCKKIGQPTVIGEIIAGIFLGPSFLGLFFPDFSSFLFPYRSLGNLQILSEIGLLLFMFIVGMELNLKVIRNSAKDALVISHASIIIPFSLGIGLAYFTYRNFAPANVKFLSYALFTGVAMSITAFPVLARMVQERGMTKTKLGTMVITCAAIDDISAWCILAAVIAIAKASSLISSVYTILMAIIYVIIMIKLVRPFLQRLGMIYSHKEGLSKPIVALIFIVLLLSSCATELIGIHALFGAFMAGIIMPSNLNFRSIFIEKIEDVALVLLLPLFFVYTGLRTQIGLLNDFYLWQVCGLIILVAVTGKFAGSAFAARFVGQNWRDSLLIGALMNTRGLIELVVLNIGYDLGILSPEIFAMMVIMALFTTFITGPAHDLINRFVPEKWGNHFPEEAEAGQKFRILISFGSPNTGKAMLRLVNSFAEPTENSTSITALHLSPSNEINQTNIHEYEQESFQPIVKEAKKLNLTINTVFKPSNDIYRELVQTANNGGFDIMFIGTGKSLFEGSQLGKFLGLMSKITHPVKLLAILKGKEKLLERDIFDENVRQIIRSSRISLGIFIDRGLSSIGKVSIPLYYPGDSFLIDYAKRLAQNCGTRINVIQFNGNGKDLPGNKKLISLFLAIAQDKIEIFSETNNLNEFMKEVDLVLISYDGWKKAVKTRSQWVKLAHSVLIVKP
jgi:Kef-type K+ transport system membrane component KefB